MQMLQQVINTLEQEHGFTASYVVVLMFPIVFVGEAEISTREKQLKSRITKWGFDIKNVKGDTMIQIARTKLKRKRVDGKDSVFRVNEKPVPERNINRYLKRNNISEEDLFSVNSPVDRKQPSLISFDGC
jgi:hypothetical protein